MPRLWIGLLLLTTALAPLRAGGEEEAYRNLRLLKEHTQQTHSETAAATFIVDARRFLETFPRSGRVSRVRFWLGEAIERRDPAAAYAAYRRSREPGARDRADRLELRYESPPPLSIDRWVGAPIDPQDENGKVTAVVFLGLTHPQTTRVVPYLLRYRERWASKGLRICVVAAVIDDFAHQRPKDLEARARKWHLPFPVGIDRQRPERPSVTFSAYRATSLPWIAVYDRYGRIGWLDAASPTPTSLARFERAVRALLHAPTYDRLAASVRAGDPAALDALASVRAKRTVTMLLELLKDRNLKPAMRAALRRTLRGLAPAHLARDPAALSRWQKEQRGLRYSLALDRVTPCE